MVFKKAKTKWGHYFTRKDRRNIEGMWHWYRKKWLKKQAHSIERNYKDEISNGGMYKKLFDLPWILY